MSSCRRDQRLTSPLIAFGIALVLTLSGAASGAQAPDPLSSLVAKEPGASACFQRVYDAAHLKRHPRQSTRSVLLLVTREIQPFEIGMRVRLEDSRRPSAVFMRAGCSWAETDVNKGDFTGEPLVPNFPKNSG